ncbi:amino acid permease [Luteolibacter yonseiensis]|uniref:Amino acid permease n=1 Tax=Luteolibacter yonseiensis TaxID=1144680 RepID=A0A934R4G3_9BACT|nr:APC family permease [Luteolibacter yonseiensis]MBK1816091.1 amino acid permease [Luteolibacter yonseiensis]
MPSETPPTRLQPALGRWQVLFYGLGSMLGAGIYALVGRAAESLGNAIWLAFLAAMIAALLTGLSYACVGGRYPKAGGAAYVTQRALKKPAISYMVGIAVMMSGLTSMATGSQAIAENLEKVVGMVLPTKLVAVFLVFLIGCVIFRGMRESMWANIVCTVVEAGGLLFIIAVGVRFWGGVNYLETPGDAAGGIGSGITLALVLQGAVLMFFSFIGFEDVLNVSEEVEDPKRDIPFGLVGAMILATLIYMGVAITAVSVLPWRELAASKTPLMEVAHRAAPWFGGIDRVYLGITIFAIGNTALLNYLMGSRLLYGMSRQGLLPTALGRLHARRGTPHLAILVLFGIVSLLILSGGVKPLAEATVLLLLSVFTLVNISLIVLKRRSDEARDGFDVPILVPVLGALVCALLVVVRVQAAFSDPKPGSAVAPLIALGIFVVSCGLYFLMKPGVAEDTEWIEK